MSEELDSLRDRLRAFAAERDWDQFHTPKNLACAVLVEAGELLERFQWLTAEQSQNLAAQAKARVSEEIADVLIYLIRLSDKLDIDMVAAAHAKIERNAQRYPPDKARGNIKKYTEL
jgi:NTP pyrophosphatase (non-canonical NTP hydrolase)